MSSTSYTYQSPSVSLEKGAYRMRAPRNRPPTALRYSNSGPHSGDLSTVSQDRKMLVLVILLSVATVTSFGTAYYLFTTRWTSEAFPCLSNTSADSNTQVVPYKQFDFQYDRLKLDAQAKFLSYLPHSGFHNQRIAFENALVLSRLLNRTLLVPPIYLGNIPIRYAPFDTLSHVLSLSVKKDLHCQKLPSYIYPPTECVNFTQYTFLQWDWLVNLAAVESRQTLLPYSNFSASWLQDRLAITENNTLTLRDSDPYNFRFLDSLKDASPSKDKYLQSVYVPDLTKAQERLLQIGTLFGSSRLRLRIPESKLVRKDVRRSMAFSNPLLDEVADNIREALGNMYLGAHIRMGDGHFKDEAESNTRLIWWKLTHHILKFDLQETLTLEHKLRASEFDDDEWNPPLIAADVAALRSPHPSLSSLPETFSTTLPCRETLHQDPFLRRLNVPLFISTDSPDPVNDPLMKIFFRTFPCVFVLSDFVHQTVPLQQLVNAYDGLPLKDFLLPFVDAMVVARAHETVITDGSTFSRFVQDILWRTFHGFEIVQRG